MQKLLKVPLLLLTLLMLGYHITTAQSCWLEASGSQIVNAETNQPVVLRAVGLGNWLLQEGYMLNPQGCAGCPNNQWQMKRQYYNEGQSKAQVENFYQQWRDNFITKADIDYIASLGFNSVRLPMHYELFLTDAQRAVRNNVITDINYGHDVYKNSLQTWYNNNQLFNDSNLEGYRVIDNLIQWCADNGMYIILDLHALPGGQGSDMNIADIFHANNLWQFPVFQDVTNRLWERISNRYKNEPRIAFYDLINEPNNVPGGGQAIHALTQRLITTIRNNGDNHMLMVQGNGWGNNYDYLEPFTFAPNWGLVYNAHRYWIDAADDWVADSNPNQINRMVNLVNFRNNYNVPVWVGETGENNNAWLSQNISWLEEYGIGWCHWTYKRHDVGQNAALMRISGNYPSDGASAMSSVLESIKFQNCISNNNTIAAVTQQMPPPWTTGCYGGTTNPGNTAPIGQTIWIRGSNNLYASTENGQTTMMCNRTSVQDWEQFTVVDAGGGKIALRGSNNLYVTSMNGQSGIICDRPTIQGWEAFDWVDFGNGTFGLKGSNGLFVSSMNGQSTMICDRVTAGSWEAFTWGTGAGARTLEESDQNTPEDLLVNIYPNPNQGQFTIETKSYSRTKIFDLSGQLVYSTSLIQDQTTISGLDKGAYVIFLSNDEKTITKKLLVN